MSVTDAAAPRTSADLRAELAQIAGEMIGLDGKAILFDDKIAELALSVYRKDPTAAGRIVQCREHKAKIADEIVLLKAARATCEAELAEALQREAAEARKAISDEALAFAEAISSAGAALDEAARSLHDGFVELKRRLHQAEQRGYGPNGEIVRTNLTQALRAALWRITELAVEPPHEGRGRSFSSLTVAWSNAARGGAQRLPGAPMPKANGVHTPTERKIPAKTDVGDPLPGDDASFTVYSDVNTRDQAIAAAAAGPKDGGA